ncbi:CD59 glycoprotein-like [Myxocyprinus asiaticus]|uniref:CD59 glycoprotein-like n=1 Tax=Myxocyprinus asiaticus TaxID=70543 RepID=UPI00222185F2|nr:CD59 glycoprotein-like [Myxocyprinus asiaticus]
MKCSFGLFLVICCMTLSLGSSLRCYKCEDYFGGQCKVQQECSYEDACLYLYEKGGKTVRKCIRYTDCDNSGLSQQFPSISEYTYMCCHTDLCNSSPATTAGTSFLSLMTAVTGLWWCCFAA